MAKSKCVKFNFERASMIMETIRSAYADKYELTNTWGFTGRYFMMALELSNLRPKFIGNRLDEKYFTDKFTNDIIRIVKKYMNIYGNLGTMPYYLIVYEQYLLDLEDMGFWSEKQFYEPNRKFGEFISNMKA